jgi:predicted ATPase/class 3 adenylate cyclase
MAEVPSGTVTFLFTDVEGSTRLWQDAPDAMREAAARHDAIVREAIEARNGYVVKTTGDGFHAAFASARDAIDAAVDAQLALGAETWEPTVPMRVRMGIHSGLAEVRDGDYYGTAVNKAARLMSVAHGGQIVVSLATEELVQDGDVALVDLGEHALRDLARPERVFQIAHPELAREFPRLSSLDAFSGNLPLQVSSFVGRDDDVARIVEMLGDASLVTLTGTGGVGKTRLAVQAAAEALPRFSDGAWFCELAAVDDGDAMAQVVAASVGCVQRAGLTLAESIVEYLKVRELLLVLDNCEHLLDDAGDFADAVVRSCPNVSVIATSREALDVSGERVVRVRSLPAPASSARPEELVASTAVQLFADRAADFGADTTWDDRQWAAVGEICRRVDGIPLAIELAAARTTSMSPADVSTHLDERFRLLTGKRRGRVERHQTLRATVEWSYQLLEDDERVVFDRLGVFAGTFDAPAAVAVASGDDLDSWDVTEALASLVAKSMLQPETGSDGTTRYGMLETLRQFARERLDEQSETDRWRRAHAEHYATWTDEIGRGFVGADHVLWVGRLRADFDNIRPAVGWALERDDAYEQALGLRILASLEECGVRYPGIGVGALATQAVAAAETSEPELRVPVLSCAAYYEWNQGRADRALELVLGAQRDGVVATTVNPFAPFLGAVVFEMAAGNHARAVEIANETRVVLDAVDNPYAESNFLAGIANFEAMAGQFEQARADAERALELARRTRNVCVLCAALHGVAWARQRDDPTVALAAAEEYIDLYREYGVGTGATSSVLALAGGLRARLGDDTGAVGLFHEAITVARDHGVRPQLAATLDWSLSPLLRTGRAEVAATFIGALTNGPLAGVADFPLVAGNRARAAERSRTVLGDATDGYFGRGAAMSYDELVAYAIGELEPDGD